MADDRPLKHGRTVSDTLPAPGDAASPRDTLRLAPFEPAPDTGDLPRVLLGAGGPIELRSSIGLGGTARVWRGRQRSLRRDVAVKAPLSSSAERHRSFVREALVTGWLAHPNIAPVHELGVDEEGRPILVMKLIEGQSWEAALDARAAAEIGRSHDLELQLRILIQVCYAIELAHQRGVLHRDLKPANVMLGAFGEVLLVDWGLAVALDEEAAIRAQRAIDATGVCGTPAYMPPEMAGGRAADLSPATDTYLLGAIAHEIAVGRPPHRGKSPREALAAAARGELAALPAHVPDELAAILRRALSPAPGGRYATAAALREALEGFLRHQHAAGLCVEGSRQLAAMGEGVGSAHDAFVAARFAYMQALAAWPDSPAARTGLQRALEAMATRHLDAGDGDAALELLDALPEPRADLRARALAVRAERTAAARELVALRDVAHQHDLDVGRRSRSLVFLVIALLWGGAALGVGGMVETGRLTLNHQQRLPFMLLTGGALYALLWIKRRALMTNQVNRRFLAGFAVVVSADIANALISRRFDIAIAPSLVLEMLLTLLVLVCFAVFVEARLGWAGAAFSIFVGIAVADPARVMIWLGLAVLAAFSTLAWLSHTAPRSGSPASPAK